jgi:ABC-type nickel/cobalt efflux system permease component RcnA
MIGMIRPLTSILRASLLALLVLGLIIRPVLTQISDLHSMEHAAFAMANEHDSDDDHGHEHHHDQDHGVPEGSPKGDPNEDHGKGAHGLMHQPSVGGASLDIACNLLVVPVIPPMAVLPMPMTSPVPLQNLATPFRPPIV